ncbi:MAG: sulfotransferase family protein [Anaerolineae bacterium]
MASSAVRPIFIVGVHRSGTTLLRYMLGSHSRIYIPPESDFIPNFFLHRPTKDLSDEEIVRFLHTIFDHYRFVKEWQGEPPEPDQFALSMPDRTPAAYLDTLYSAYARQYGAQRWGDKTPIYASYVDLIHEIFPNAQFLHIIRDGRDAALSMLDKYERDEFHVDIFFAARNWVRRIRSAQRAGSQLGPDLYYELRYEDLIEDPESELRAVCEFLGETYEPGMVEYHQTARERIPANSHFFSNVRNPPSRQRIGRWQEEMPERDQRLVQAVAGKLLVELGYPLVDLGSMSIEEQARLATLAAKYAMLQSGRRVLQAFGLFPPI